MQEYKWKLPSFAKGINPELAVEELKRIEDIFGSLTPEHILKASSSEDALFHSLFTWDDSEAANQYRLQQARNIINNVEIITISSGEKVSFSPYEVVTRPEGRIYMHVNAMNHNDIEEVRERIILELNGLKKKLSVYKNFGNVLLKLDEAVEVAKNV